MHPVTGDRRALPGRDRRLMRALLLGLAALTMSASALAQGFPPGGDRGGPPGGGPPGGGPPRPMKPIKFEKLEKPIRAMFQAADTDRDGIVRLAEFQQIIADRREAAIRERFARIDSDRDGSIDIGEFLAWQRMAGSAETQPLLHNGAPISETIEPELGDGMEDRVLARLIVPLSTLAIVDANTNYDQGMSLEELIALQRKRFDEADRDGDGEISMEELRGLEPRGEGPGPGRPRGPGRSDAPPPCPEGATC